MFLIIIFSQLKLFQELYESYRSYSRTQWENNLVPTQEAMAVLGRKCLTDLPEDLKTEVLVANTKQTNPEVNAQNESMNSTLNLSESKASNSCWHIDETSQAQLKRHAEVS